MPELTLQEKKANFPNKGKKGPCGGFVPAPEAIYTEEVVVDIIKKAREVVLNDEKISLDGELGIALYKQGITTSVSTLINILFKYKNNNTVKNFKQELDCILESRKCKDKSMYPGIAAMALKNKHGWLDSQDLRHSGKIDSTRTNITIIEDKDGIQADSETNARKTEINK